MIKTIHALTLNGANNKDYRILNYPFMSENYSLYKQATALVGIGVWEYNVVSEELFWDDMTRMIYETDEGYHPSLIDTMGFFSQIPSVYGVENELEKIVATAPHLDCQVEIKTQKGNYKWISSNAKTEWVNGQCTKLIGTVQDITDVRASIEKLRLSGNNFYNAFNHSPIGMALVSTAGRWIKVNDCFCQMLGYTMEELGDLTFQDITYADDLDKDVLHLKQMLNKELKTYSTEKRYLKKDGEIIWVLITASLVSDKDDTPLYFVTQVMEITDKIRKTEMLIKKGNGISNIINSRKIGAWEWHIEADVFVCDERCAIMLGYSEKELLNTMTKWLSNVHPEDLTGLTKRLEYCFLNKTDYNCEHRMRHQNGNWIWIESHGEVIEWSAEGKPLIMLGTEADITAKKQIELDQKNVMDLLSVQNERLTNFAYIVSHNLRSHAGNFQMMLDLYADEQVEEEKDVIINLLRKNASNLSETLSNLNEVVDIQLSSQKQLKTLNLCEQVNKALINLKGMIDKEGARFSIHIDQTLQIEYRPAYLESILLNLFSNALKYRHPFRTPEISVEATLDEDGGMLKISDNGMGIDLNLHGGKIFGMYKTFHPHKDARGIGLFLTKSQVEAMGGKIEVESVYGTGTTFKIYLIKRK